MAKTRGYSAAFLRAVLNAYTNIGTVSGAAVSRGVPRETFRYQLAQARAMFMPQAHTVPMKTVKHAEARAEKPAKVTKINPMVKAVRDLIAAPADDVLDGEQVDLEAEVRALRATVKKFEKGELTQEYIRRKLIKLNDSPVNVPRWLTDTNNLSTSPGVPTLFASDWHWAEVVDRTQVGGTNEYNLAIGKRRARKLINTAIDLLKNHIAHPDYPGIVFALGGDMVTGNIHEELLASNEAEIMPTVLDIFGVLVWCINTLADEFGKVFLPCVSGNHGRDTHKIRSKGRNFTSFDWLIYCFLAKHFEADERITFYIPNGSDALYKVFNHTYLLTHGDQFRGGDGMIGALGPIIRGDHKKRSRQAQIGAAYDTMLLGHWHQLIQLQRLIVNGSLIGYNEYAMAGNFGYEEPRQALWITHPQHGITFSMPVNVEAAKITEPASWVSWSK